MIFRSSLLRSISRAGLFNRASQGSGFETSHRCAHTFSCLAKNSITESPLKLSTLGDRGLNSDVLGIPKNVSMPYRFCSRHCSHSGPQDEGETGSAQGPTGSAQRPMDHFEGLPLEYGRSGFGRFTPYPTRIMEGNADIVHIKLMRNNAFVTLTDSKGNKKLGVTAGKLAGKGGNLARYSAESAAEDIGQKVRQMKIKSVVVKVKGPTLFRRKKQAILSFKDGYSHSREESHPVVYIEDTTRKPHNGCRLKKKRRI